MSNLSGQKEIRIHSIKLNTRFVDPVSLGLKKFEIRKNDRRYLMGDYLQFRAVNNDGRELEHPIKNMLFKVTYLMHIRAELDGCGINIDDDTVVMSIKRLNEKETERLLEDYVKQNRI